MKCRKCKNVIPDGSIYCNFCGEKQLRERKKKDEIKVPEPRQLPSGKWNIQLRKEGWSTTEETRELCIAKARAVRAGFVEVEKKKEALPLTKAIDLYIERRSELLSPSTLRGYRAIQRGRFPEQMVRDIHETIDWQAVVNREAERCSAKTLKNSWRFIGSVLRDNDVAVPRVLLPQVVRPELPWLDYEQILVFAAAAQGTAGEVPALLALHSLRRSEICGLRWCDIDTVKQTVHVNGAVVAGEDQKFVRKTTTKNVTSNRVIPFMIPRLQTLLTEQKASIVDEEAPVVECYPNTIQRRIDRICEASALPLVGVHGLRRSFASLAYHLGFREEETMAFGGWSDYKTVHDIYIKLAESDKSAARNRMIEFYANY